ncbi:ATP-binding protein [Halobacteriovorax sp. GB3]|uniref:ATP-binding protein n=1 Tax=Halobacteriovorax sp. GB3 TaxID=2719615 RepID=UPI00235DEAC8|nr:ATP-binding protein [Halobacteriovorax sp. GB3]MDD0852497.1 ATP-binding protein [Halobacteriovorax sp. GB3]
MNIQITDYFTKLGPWFLEVSNFYKTGTTEQLTKELFLIGSFILLPLVYNFLKKKIMNQAVRMRLGLINSITLSSLETRAAFFLQWAGPFIPYVLALVFLVVARKILMETALSDLVFILSFIKFYVVYLIFNQLFISALRLFSEFAGVKRERDKIQKILNDSKLFARYLLFFFGSLYAIELTLKKGLVYEYAFKILFIILIGLFYKSLRNWSVETQNILKKYYPKMETILFSGSAFIKNVLLPVGFLLAFFHFFWKKLKGQISEWSITRALATKLFQKKLETSEQFEETNIEDISNQYRSAFQENRIYVEQKVVDKIFAEVDEWLVDKSEEHTVAIYGEKGVGKTLALNKLAERLQGKDCEVIYHKFNEKVSTKKQLFSLVADLLGIEEFEEISKIIEFDQKNEKKVVLFDDAHHLFLSEYGGLEGVKALFEILNARTENIFWVASFNQYSWSYISQVFKKNQYFRAVYRVDSLSEEALQDYIMTIHNSTKYQISYSDIIQALRTSDETGSTSYVETLFFRMLWDTSKGNVALATHLWFSSLRPWRRKAFKVGVPVNKKTDFLSGLSDDTLFIFASIMRHESIRARELVGVTNISEGTVRHALRIGLENEVLIRNDDGIYSYNVSYQYPLVKHLKTKNFIYEE